MLITNIKIKNYKSIAEINLKLVNRKMLALIGINNVGKTNILEAINTIKNINGNKSYYYDSKEDDNLNFNTFEKTNKFNLSENFNNQQDNYSNFYFEITLKYVFKKETIKLLIDSKNTNKDVLLNKIVSTIINKYESILKTYFKNKYILENNFNYFVKNLQKILEDPFNFKPIRNNYFPFNNDIAYKLTNEKKIELWIKDFLEKNYVFSKKEIHVITKDLIEFLNEFKDLKEIVKNYDFNNKIFYLSTSLQSYNQNFQVFQTINISEKKIQLIPINNYLSALIYNNDNYQAELEKINQLLETNKLDLNEKILTETNEYLKAKFMMTILNDNYNKQEKYLIYPKLLIKDKILNSTLIIIKKNKKEFAEDILLMSEGLRNKLLLKLNLNYCKKHKEKEIILLLDEPDRSLHISAILELYHEFQELVNTTKTKIIYTTHSPYLLGNIFENHKNILIVEKDKTNKTIINTHSQINISQLSDTCLGKMINITGSNYLIINALNSNFNYVTVEGKTDYEFYTWYNKHYNKNKNLYFVAINGKGKKDLINILKKLKLNFISLYDNDYKIKDKNNEHKIVKYNQIFENQQIKDLETLLDTRKKKHLNIIKENDNINLNNFYKEIINKNEIKTRIDKIFAKINAKLDILND